MSTCLTYAPRWAARKRKARPEPGWRAVHRVAELRERRLAGAFKEGVQAGRRAVDFNVFHDAFMNRGTDQYSLDLAADRTVALMEPPIRKAVERALGDVLRAAGKAELDFRQRPHSGFRTSAVAKPLTTFGATNPRVLRWIRDHAATQVQGISNQSRQAIRDILHDSFEQGIPTAKVARRIRSVIGLTADQAAAVVNLARTIADNPGNKVYAGETPIRVPEEPSDEFVESRLERYADKLLNDRAKSIARTETIAAANEGQRQAWLQAEDEGLIKPGEVERVWIVTPDDRLCPICEDMEGSTAPLGGSFQSNEVGSLSGPPAHPQCRCAQGLQPVSAQEMERAASARGALAGPHKWCSTQINLEGKARQAILSAGRAIPKEWLAEQGLETEPHVTVLYGLHDAFGLQERMEGFGRVALKFGAWDAFEGVEGGTADALLIKVEGKDLPRMREHLSALPHKESDHGEYIPHATVAYVRPGLGKDLAQKFQGMFRGMEFTTNALTFSGRLGERRRIPLGGQPFKEASL